MSKEKVYRTVQQYSRGPVAKETMDKLMEIGEDYRTVKNYVYRRFGGIHSLDKLYPGYTVQKDVYKRQVDNFRIVINESWYGKYKTGAEMAKALDDALYQK